MSLRRFNGWEPELVHYDGEGNITGRTVAEPEWDDEQREIALEFESYKRMLCPNCGGHLLQSQDKNLARDVREAPRKCLDCEAIQQTRDLHHAKICTKDKCDCSPHELAVWVDRYIAR